MATAARSRARRVDGPVGDCFRNAVAESFFATLECELLDRSSWLTRRELATELFDFIEGFYNRTSGELPGGEHAHRHSRGDCVTLHALAAGNLG